MICRARIEMLKNTDCVFYQCSFVSFWGKRVSEIDDTCPVLTAGLSQVSHPGLVTPGPRRTYSPNAAESLVGKLRQLSLVGKLGQLSLTRSHFLIG